ncbi:MAG: hypothetical protein AAGB04_13690 [Pseudomonadota bacterium]
MSGHIQISLFHVIFVGGMLLLVILFHGLPLAVFFTIFSVMILSACFAKGRAFLSSTAICTTPFFFGLLVVALYFQIHQIEFDKLDLFLFEVPFAFKGSDWLKFAEFEDTYKEPFYTAISTLYAIVVALALVKGLEDRDELNKALSEEAFHIRNIFNYLKYFEPGNIGQETNSALTRMRQILRGYAASITDSPNLSKRSRKAIDENRARIDQCRQVILNIKPADDDDRIVYPEIIKNLEQLNILRTRRVEGPNQSLSWYLICALWLMSAALILPFLAEPVCIDQAAGAKSGVVSQSVAGAQQAPAQSATKVPASDASNWLQSLVACPNGQQPRPGRYSQYYMIFIMVAFFSFMMLMLHDIATPDKGFWKLDREPFENLVRDLDADYGDAIAPTGSEPPGQA